MDYPNATCSAAVFYQINVCTMENNHTVVRDRILLEQLVLVDGLPCSGKAVLDVAVSSMDRVELLQFATQIERICVLLDLGKITSDAAETLIRLEADLVLYNTMMSRNVNFRMTDQSSVFKDPEFWVYIKRLFTKGDRLIPDRIRNERPILHFMTHSMLSFSEPIFNSFGDKVAIIEIVRHPMSMLEQQTSYEERWATHEGKLQEVADPFLRYKDDSIPYWAAGLEDLYYKSNPVERAIYVMRDQLEKIELFKNKFRGIYEKQCITIPFEMFVVDPWPYLEKIEVLLKTKMTRKTNKMLKKSGVPRNNTGLEAHELNKNRDFAIQNGASEDALRVLDQISEQYEDKYDLHNQKQ